MQYLYTLNNVIKCVGKLTYTVEVPTCRMEYNGHYQLMFISFNLKYFF